MKIAPWLKHRWIPFAVLCGMAAPISRADDAASSLAVRSSRVLPEKLPVERIPVGEPDDYKPCIARLGSGELRLIAFHQYALKGDPRGPVREDMILFRSTDDGRTWSKSDALPIVGREPYFSLTKHGTLFITAHLLERDERNRHGYLYCYVHRSADKGRTWSTAPILSQDVPEVGDKTWTHTSRNVLELADGTLILGVSAPKGNDYLWRSGDGGETWDRTLRCEFEGLDKQQIWWPFWAETVFWQSRNGDLLALLRVDSKVFPLPESEVPEGYGDQSERLVVFRSRNGGGNWALDKPLGSTYGEMYPAILRLADGRLLMTFTVRAVKTPLGVHAVLGTESDDGFEFDFQHDRVVIDAKTPVGSASGGGFGPTVQAADGTLITAYSYRGADSTTHLEVARWRLPR